MKKIVCLFALICMTLVAAPAMAAELVDNPTYKSWTKFKPGTSVTYVQEMTMGGTNMNMEMIQTLKEVSAERAVVEVAVKNSMMPAGGQTQSVNIPAKVDAAAAENSGKLPPGFQGEVKSLGKETIKVGDKAYETEVSEFKGEQSQHGMKFEGKTWTSNEVPGQMVKTEMKGTGEGPHGGMTVTMTLKELVEGKEPTTK